MLRLFPLNFFCTDFLDFGIGILVIQAGLVTHSLHWAISMHLEVTGFHQVLCLDEKTIFCFVNKGLDTQRRKIQGNYSLRRPPKLIINKNIHWPKMGYLQSTHIHVSSNNCQKRHQFAPIKTSPHSEQGNYSLRRPLKLIISPMFNEQRGYSKKLY